MTSKKVLGRKRRQRSVRKRVVGSDDRPRLCVYRSSRHIYAQVISDQRGVTLLSASTLSRGEEATGQSKGVDAARQVGAEIARLCGEKRITRVVFDRNGFLFHGRVKALAEAAREAGLVF